MGRTALHYAAALGDHGYMYKLLLKAAPREDIQDLVLLYSTKVLYRLLYLFHAFGMSVSVNLQILRHNVKLIY